MNPKNRRSKNGETKKRMLVGFACLFLMSVTGTLHSAEAVFPVNAGAAGSQIRLQVTGATLDPGQYVDECRYYRIYKGPAQKLGIGNFRVFGNIRQATHLTHTVSFSISVYSKSGLLLDKKEFEKNYPALVSSEEFAALVRANPAYEGVTKDYGVDLSLLLPASSAKAVVQVRSLITGPGLIILDPECEEVGLNVRMEFHAAAQSVALAPATEPFRPHDEIRFTANTSGFDPSTAITYTWFLDGVRQAQSSSNFQRSSLVEGWHTIRVVADDGQGRLAEAEKNFAVVPEVQLQVLHKPSLETPWQFEVFARVRGASGELTPFANRKLLVHAFDTNNNDKKLKQDFAVKAGGEPVWKSDTLLEIPTDKDGKIGLTFFPDFPKISANTHIRGVHLPNSANPLELKIGAEYRMDRMASGAITDSIPVNKAEVTGWLDYIAYVPKILVKAPDAKTLSGSLYKGDTMSLSEYELREDPAYRTLHWHRGVSRAMILSPARDLYDLDPSHFGAPLKNGEKLGAGDKILIDARTLQTFRPRLMPSGVQWGKIMITAGPLGQMHYYPTGHITFTIQYLDHFEGTIQVPERTVGYRPVEVVVGSPDQQFPEYQFLRAAAAKVGERVLDEATDWLDWAPVNWTLSTDSEVLKIGLRLLESPVNPGTRLYKWAKHVQAGTDIVKMAFNPDVTFIRVKKTAYLAVMDHKGNVLVSTRAGEVGVRRAGDPAGETSVPANYSALLMKGKPAEVRITTPEAVDAAKEVFEFADWVDPAPTPNPTPVPTPSPTPNPNPGVPGDFNRDGRSDLLWRHERTGRLSVWTMNGATNLGSLDFGTSATAGWQLLGSGDFDRNGSPDLIWMHESGRLVVWLMQNESLLSSKEVAKITSRSWKFVGTGDFNADGKCDMVWQYEPTGKLQALIMDGVRFVSTTDLGTVDDPLWRAVAAADFNRDSHPDLLLHHSESGEMLIWVMRSGSRQSTAKVGTLKQGWQICGVGDYLGDGNSHILFEEVSRGFLRLGKMNTLKLAGEEKVSSHGDLLWRVVAPRREPPARKPGATALPFYEMSGQYHGILGDLGDLQPSTPTSSITDSFDTCLGSISLVINARGGFTAKAVLLGTTFRGRGVLGEGGKLETQLLAPREPALPVDLEFVSSPSGAKYYEGSVSESPDLIDAIAGYRPFSARNPMPGPGTFALSLPVLAASSTTMKGTGAGVVILTPAGMAKIVAQLPDQTRLVVGLPVWGTTGNPEDIALLIYQPLYRNNGSAGGWINRNNLENWSGILDWIAPDSSSGGTTVFPDGLFVILDARMHSHSRPARGEPLFSNWIGGQGRLRLSGGGLPAAEVAALTMTANNQIEQVTPGTGGALVRIRVDPSQGTFFGTLRTPQFTGSAKVFGCIDRSAGRGSGYFLSPAGSGRVSLEP